MLNDLFVKPHRTESTLILWFRRLVIFILLLLLLIVFVILSIGVANEVPNVQSTFSPNDSGVPAPVTFDPRFDPSNNISIKFLPKGNIILSSNYNRTNAYYLRLYISITDPTYNASLERPVSMYAFDSDDEFVQSIRKMNHYYLPPVFSVIQYSRIIKKSMVQTLWTYIGFPSDYRTVTYLQTDTHIASIDIGNRNRSNYAMIQIQPKTNTIETQIEQRSNTVAAIFGVIAGLYSASIGFYAILFGTGSAKPWGLMHKCYVLKKQTMEGIKPLVLDSSSSNENYEKRLEDLESLTFSQRVKRLEKFNLFLEDYIVNAQLLYTINKDKNDYSKLLP
ncbi:19980_t:CDS:2 [Racocetra persica]|uniref:19980_t:CDS:1 n=1 Tax=Racocetra persica TaxID=160502 RepID=A0ACA9LB38_9GLOM|nr:19980_t:CDS:2 [Racocetra persica]